MANKADTKLNVLGLYDMQAGARLSQHFEAQSYTANETTLLDCEHIQAWLIITLQVKYFANTDERMTLGMVKLEKVCKLTDCAKEEVSTCRLTEHLGRTQCTQHEGCTEHRGLG